MCETDNADRKPRREVADQVRLVKGGQLEFQIETAPMAPNENLLLREQGGHPHKVSEQRFENVLLCEQRGHSHKLFGKRDR